MRTSKNQRGVVAIMVAMSILLAATVMLFYSARVVITDQMIFNHTYNRTSAQDAAESGVNYALGYLNSHLFGVQSTGLAYCSSISNIAYLTYGGSPVAYSDSSPPPSPLPTSTLANGATYTMKYACITAGSVSQLTVSSTGTSRDGTASRTVTVTVAKYVVGRDLTGSSAADGVGVALAVGNIAGTPANVLLKSSSTTINVCTVGSGGCPTSPAITIVSAGNVSGVGVVIQQSATVCAVSSGACDGATFAPLPTLNKNTVVANYPPIFQYNNSTLANLTTADIQNNYLGYLFCGTQGASSCACAATDSCLTTNLDVKDIPHNNDGRYNNGSSTGDKTYDASTQTTFPTGGITVSGSNGKIVFIDVGINNTATFNGAFRVGTTFVGTCSAVPPATCCSAGTPPTTLIVNGNVILAGSTSNAAIVCGGVYATGNVQLNNAANVFGFIIGLQGVAVNTAAGAGVTGSLVAGPNAAASANFPNGFGMTSGGFVNLSKKTGTDGLDTYRYNEYGFVPGSWRDF